MQALGPDLNVDPSNWRWVHCLERPSMHSGSRKDHTNGSAIVVEAEGDPSSSLDSPDLVNYDAGLSPPFSTITPATRSGEECSWSTRSNFSDDVAEQDGQTCVLTSLGARLCDAVHLLTHNKGDTVCYSYSQSVLTHHLQYITYAQRRSRDRTGGDIVQDIDNVRNGQVHSHRVGYRCRILDGVCHRCDMYL